MHVAMGRCRLGCAIYVCWREQGDGGQGGCGGSSCCMRTCMRARAYWIMWRLPQQLRIGPVLDRVIVFVGEAWERCEWCDERIGFSARHEEGNWQFVCPECAEPWLHVPYGPGLRGIAEDLGGLWWFHGPSGEAAGTSDCTSGWAGSSASGGSVDGGFLRIGSVFVWVHAGNRDRARGIRLEERASRPRSLRIVRALATMLPSDGGAAGGVDEPERDRTWDRSDEAIQLQNALRDEGRRRGHGRWLSLGDLVAGYRRLGAFTFEDLWLAAGLAYRNGTRRFDCFWQRDQEGGWEVWVLLREEHVLNREGR